MRYEQVKEFLNGLELVEAATARGLTWLELFMGFESVYGGEGWAQQTKEQSQHKVHSKYVARRSIKPAVKHILAEFRRSAKQVVKQGILLFQE